MQRIGCLLWMVRCGREAHRHPIFGREPMMVDGALKETGRDAGRTLIVLPAFNERDSLPGVIDEIRRHVPDADVLVVDDGSTDGTSAIARSAGILSITLPFNLGVGGAVRAGLLYGYRHGYEVVVQCDADGQHPPDCIALLIRGLD